MPRTVEELVELLDLETIDVNLFRGTQPDTSLQRVFGGQVAAQALVAGARTVEPQKSVHSLHSYFLRPGDPTVPIVYDVERIRDGRSFSTRRVMARQHGHAIYYMTLSAQVAEDGFDHQDVMPDVAAPADSVDVAELSSSAPAPAARVRSGSRSGQRSRCAGSATHDPGAPSLLTNDPPSPGCGSGSAAESGGMR